MTSIEALWEWVRENGRHHAEKQERNDGLEDKHRDLGEKKTKDKI